MNPRTPPDGRVSLEKWCLADNSSFDQFFLVAVDPASNDTGADDAAGCRDPR
jgi:hypothetical protein